jgi:hypothetical protein
MQQRPPRQRLSSNEFPMKSSISACLLFCLASFTASSIEAQTPGPYPTDARDKNGHLLVSSYLEKTFELSLRRGGCCLCGGGEMGTGGMI